MKKIAVILFNLGGPDSLAAVRPFLFNLFRDPAIIRLPTPLRQFVAWMISSRRDKVAQGIYAQIGNRSPILPNTEKQAVALENYLNAQCSDSAIGQVTSGCDNSGARRSGMAAEDQACDRHAPEAGAERVKSGGISTVNSNQYKTFITMRYWHPMADEVAQQVKAYAPDEIILLPLYPQFSTTTTDSSVKDWMRAAQRAGLSQPTRTICCYPTETGFIQAMADTIRAAYDTAKAHGSPRILFTAHGLPEKIVKAGDPYQWQCEQTTAALVAALSIPDLDYVTCYQSRVGPLAWITPATDTEIERAGANKVPVVIAPIAFVSEHSETLVEIDIEYRHLAAEQGVPYYAYVPTVGDNPTFIKGLASLVCQAAGSLKPCQAQNGGRLCPAHFSGCCKK